MTAAISCIFWGEMTLGLAMAGTASPGIAIYSMLLGLDMYHVFRAWSQAGKVDKEAKKARKNGI